MEILFRGIAKKTGQPVIGYHLKILNEHGEMVDKIYKNCGYDTEQWGFFEIEEGTLEILINGDILLKSLAEIEKLNEKDLDLSPINFGTEGEPVMRCAHCSEDVTDLMECGFSFCPYCGGRWENE